MLQLAWHVDVTYTGPWKGVSALPRECGYWTGTVGGTDGQRDTKITGDCTVLFVGAPRAWPADHRELNAFWCGCRPRFVRPIGARPLCRPRLLLH